MLEIWLLIALAILIAVIWKPLSRTIFGALDGHAGKVRAELDGAKRLREEAQSLLAEHKRQLAAGQDHARSISEHARREAERQAERHRAELEAGLARRTEQALGRIAQEEAAPSRTCATRPRRWRSRPPGACSPTRSTAITPRSWSTARSRRSAASCPEPRAGVLGLSRLRVARAPFRGRLPRRCTMHARSHGCVRRRCTLCNLHHLANEARCRKAPLIGRGSA